MKPQIVVLSFLSSLLAILLCGLVADVVAAPADAGGALVAPFDAGPDAGSGSAVAPPVAAPLPDPAEAPVESIGLLARAYKGGGLVSALILGLFFALTLAQKWVAWLRQGWRKLAVSSLLVGLAILCERIAAGTTPTLAMVLGAAVASLALLTNAKGEPKAV